MSFDVSVSNLHREKDNAVEFVNDLLGSMKQRKARYHGPAYRGDYLDSQAHSYDPENISLDFVRLKLASLAAPFDVEMSTRRPSAQRQAVEALEFAINRWRIDSDHQEHVEEVAVDYCLGYAVELTTLEVQPGYEEFDDPLMWPRISRISPHDTIFDPLANSIKEARFIGHRVVTDKSALEQRARDNPDEEWNLELISTLAENAGIEDVEQRKDDNQRLNVDRHELVYWEIWVPEHQTESKEDGYNGTLFCIAEGQDSGWEASAEDDKQGKPSPKKAYLRAPRGYFGPRWGPYSVIGSYYVPDEVAPLSALVAVQEQVNELNAQVKAAIRNDEQYKRLVLVDSGSPRLAQQLREEPDSYVLPVRGLGKDKVQVVELGGSTVEQHAAIERRRRTVRTSLGIDEAQYGAVTGMGTATEHDIAARASEGSNSYFVGRFDRGIVQSLKTVAYLMYHTDEVVIPLGQEAETELGIPEPVFVGGTFDEGSGATFDDLGLEIKRAPEGLAQQRMAQGLTMLLQVAPILPQLPYVKARRLAQMVAQIHATPELEEILDYELLAQVTQTQPQGDPADSQARMSKDLGALGTMKRVMGGSQPGKMPAQKQLEAGPKKPAMQSAMVGAA